MKLNELFLSEAFGGMGSALARKAGAALNPTASGEGARNLENKTDKLTKAWQIWRGSSKAIPNSPNIRHWVKNVLGLDDETIWDQALKTFEREYPKSAEKYLDDRAMDIHEISNFFNTILRTRLMYPEKRTWSQETKQKQNADNKKLKQAQKPKSSEKNTDNPDIDGPSGLPTHPVYSQSAMHNHPENSTYIPDDSVEHKIEPKIEPKNAELSSGNAGNIDWESIRKRFPQKPKFSIPMGSKKID